MAAVRQGGKDRVTASGAIFRGGGMERGVKQEQLLSGHATIEPTVENHYASRRSKVAEGN